MNEPLIEAASWCIVSELLRRYLRRFRLIETHPCSGMYDCLSLYDDNLTHIADFNRQGCFHVFNRCDGKPNREEPLEIWDGMIEGDPKSVLDTVCTMLGLPIPAHLPKGTPATLVYRFIASFLSQTVFGTQKWECRNGFVDTSGYGGGVVKYFDKFPGAEDRLRVIMRDDILGQPAYRFWFLYNDGVSKVCLETSGLVWAANGKSFNLPDLYKQKRRVWFMIMEVARHLLP